MEVEVNQKAQILDIGISAERAILAERVPLSQNKLLFGHFWHNFVTEISFISAEISFISAEIDLFWLKEGYFSRNTFFTLFQLPLPIFSQI